MIFFPQEKAGRDAKDRLRGYVSIFEIPHCVRFEHLACAVRFEIVGAQSAAPNGWRNFGREAEGRSSTSAWFDWDH
jgi:hypothetical protein